ncbi:MAG: glycoside hydrolase family 55 protein [Acidomyces sp. 'richmondensis']|nr:MAG: glycoside hydrolase family 55 protein [Acidomyces sp. 'richmondensis']
MVRVGQPGQSGSVQIQDMLFTVQGATAGYVLMEWNIAQSSQGSAAIIYAGRGVTSTAGKLRIYAERAKLFALRTYYT